MKRRLIVWSTLLTSAGIFYVLANPLIRPQIFHGLEKVVGSSSDSIEHWVTQLHDRDSDKRREAIDRLGEMGPEATAAIPALVEVVHTDSIALRSWAISRGLGPIGRPALPELCRLLKVRSLRTVAVVTIGEMGPEADEAVPELRAVLLDSTPWTRAMTSQALGNIGPGAKEAVPELVKALGDASALVRQNAAQALQRIDPRTAATSVEPMKSRGHDTH